MLRAAQGARAVTAQAQQVAPKPMIGLHVHHTRKGAGKWAPDGAQNGAPAGNGAAADA